MASVAGHHVYWVDPRDGVLGQTRLVEFVGEHRPAPRTADPPLPLWWGSVA